MLTPSLNWPKKMSDHLLSKSQLAQRIARDIPNSSYVNLGIGLPTLVSNFISPDANIIFHTENGMLGMGPEAIGSEVDDELINAGKIPIVEMPGASYFHHADSFAMIRGGHIDICVLGAFQVSTSGDLANWHTGNLDDIPSVGGAMDLALGAIKTFVMMNLFDKSGSSKIVAKCSMPITALNCVDRVYTDHGIFEIVNSTISLVESFGMPAAQLRERAGIS